MASPALADPATFPGTPPHSSLADGPYPGGFTFDNTIEICDLSVAGAPPCFYGVIDTTGATSTANLNSFANGQVVQLPGAGTASMHNGGTAEFGAIASAVNGAGNAQATATITHALAQKSGSFTTPVAGTVDYTIDNEGWLLIDALATAKATGTAGNATANATIDHAVIQSAHATDDVTLHMTNASTMTVLAHASAVAPDFATADAELGTGIQQFGSGDSVAITLTNSGTLNIAATAFASVGTEGFGANADASVHGAIEQTAHGTSNASVNVINAAAGVISIGAHATAIGGNANVEGTGAAVHGGIIQHANATSTTQVRSISPPSRMPAEPGLPTPRPM
jgi:hypothetical protein